MKVIAKQGTRCPKENKPREYITDSEPVDVPETSYYKRLVTDGSLTLYVESGYKPDIDEVINKKGGKK